MISQAIGAPPVPPATRTDDAHVNPEAARIGAPDHVGNGPMPALDLSGRTALQNAVRERNVSAVSALLKTGVDAAGVTTTDGTPGASRELLRAVAWSDACAVRTLLQAGANANSVGQHRQSALWTAVEERNLEIVRELLQAGADPNVASTWDGTTPLWNAVKLLQAPMVDLLLQHPGIQLRTPAQDGSSALGRARSERCYDQTEMILELFDRCERARSHPASQEWVDAAAAGDMDLLRRLVDEHGAGYVNSIADGGDSALYYSAANGRAAAVGQLLAWGAHPDLHDGDGLTALDAAVVSGHLEVVKVLVDRGANPNILKSYGDTPLYEAAYQGREDIVEVLLDGGADTDLIVGKERPAATALQMAVLHGRDKVAALLLSRGANPHLAGSGDLTTATWASRFGTPNIKAIFAAHLAAG